LTHTNAENASTEPASGGTPTQTSTPSLTEDKPQLVKTLGDLRVELQPLQIVSGNPMYGSQRDFMLTVQLMNQNPQKSIWVALSTDLGSALKATVTDPNGNQFESNWRRVSGIAYAAYQHGGFFQATEIPPNGSMEATVKFYSPSGMSASPGTCRLQMELLVGYEFVNGFGSATVQNLVTKIEAK
jgi:hypothetical protein